MTARLENPTRARDRWTFAAALAHAQLTGAVPRRTGLAAMATSTVLIVLTLRPQEPS